MKILDNVGNFFSKLCDDAQTVYKGTAKKEMDQSVALRIAGVASAALAVTAVVFTLTAIVALNPVNATVFALSAIALAVLAHMAIREGKRPLMAGQIIDKINHGIGHL